MPSDIRSFFGGPPAGAGQNKAPEKAAKKGRSSRKVLDDSDDDVVEPAPKKSNGKKTTAIKTKEATPDVETTTSDYFGDKKPKRSTPAKATTASKQNPSPSPAKATTGTRASRRKTAVNYDESSTEHGAEDEQGKGVAKAISAKPERSGGTSVKPDADEDEDEDIKSPSHRTNHSSRGPQVAVDEDDDAEMEVNEPTAKPTSRGKKRKSPTPDEGSGEEEHTSGKNKKTKPSPAAKKAPAKKKVKNEEVGENAAMQAIYDSIPTVRAPSPPPADLGGDGKKKFDYRAGAANQAAPAAAGSKEMPQGAPNCLAGLSFVFTGILETLQRDDGQALVKRYGGKVMTAPSSKTSFVVLGGDAGPKKLEVIKKFNLRTIDEDGLFELIRKVPANGGDSRAAAQQEEKEKAQMRKVMEMSAQMDEEMEDAAKAADKPAPNSELWTVKHAPTALNQICGNKAQVEKLQLWLRAFPKNQRTKFKMAGASGSGVYRAVMIHGPPGIGKTTAAHLVARLEGYDVVESNASDTRSKKLVEAGLKGVLSTTSLLGYFAGDGKKVDQGKKKLVLIMDEVDGMSAGDRGGVGALAAVCKKSQIPMILICNDRKLPKMKPFDGCTYELPFRRPTTEQIRARIMTISFREGLKIPTNVIDALVEGSKADIRQVVNMVSTAKLDQEVQEQNMDFDRGKQMSKAWEKNVILRPWDIVSKILGGGMFAASSKSTLNDKSELYFNDHEFSYLMLQENYLGTNPTRASTYSGQEKALKSLELVEEAANSISEGDLIDRMIHGTQQQWSLMPAHAMSSFVRPASFVAGSLAGHQTRFTQWLGKNSSFGKAMRQVKEIQGHMRLRSSADRHEVRQQYMPALWAQLVQKLAEEGKDSVPEIIDLMDSYFLTKDDWDAIAELGVGPMDFEKLSIDSQSKSAFTRIYNQQNHPMPFMKASNVTAPKAVSKDKPDLEEAIEESEDEELLNEVKEEDEEGDLDLSKDKYVKQAKKKKAASTAKGKGAKAKADEDEDDVDTKPKKGKAAAKGKDKAGATKARAR